MYGEERVIGGSTLVERTTDGILVHGQESGDPGYFYFPVHRVYRIGYERLRASQYSPPTATAPQKA
jgi:hypothetical protein